LIRKQLEQRIVIHLRRPAWAIQAKAVKGCVPHING
jgi:hypothetical protein